MRAITRTVLAVSFAVLAAPQAADAFSLGPIPDAGTSRQVEVPASRGSDRADQQPVLMAQADDSSARIGQLAEQVRKLTGQVQDLNYQLLQMQEQMRQMQKDNEFRFQRLEGGSSGGSAQDGDHSENRTDHNHQTAVRQPSSGASRSHTGAPPSTLGSMTFDGNGDIVGGAASRPGANASGPDTASLPSPSGSPADIYRAAYAQILNGDYASAARGFRDYLDIYPDGPKAADATYWLGESQFSQRQFDEAAKTFLSSYKKYPKAEKAPDSLLKLGMALAALDNRDTACATYREVLKRYPDSSGELRRKVAAEQKHAGC